MATMNLHRYVRTWLAGVLLCAGASAHAQPTTTTTTLPTRVKCYRVRDSIRTSGPQGPWMTLTGTQAPDEHCKIFEPFRRVCVPVGETFTATGITPAPTPLAVAQPAQDQICYRIRCDKSTGPSSATSFNDEFGKHTFTNPVPEWICEPAAKQRCGDSIVDINEQCDEGANNGKTGHCCDANCHFVAAGMACADTSASDCEKAECDGAGACVQNFAFEAMGKTCGPDTTPTDCLSPKCDGAGNCDQTLGFEATTKVCGTGDTDCTHQRCDGAGTCDPIFIAAGTGCTETDMDACTSPACDGAGSCQQDYSVRNCPPMTTCNPADGTCN
jgi:hypothetical protein